MLKHNFYDANSDSDNDEPKDIYVTVITDDQNFTEVEIVNLQVHLATLRQKH